MSSQRQPIFNVPSSIVWILGLLIVIHLLRQQVSAARDAELLQQFAFVPARLSWLWNPQGVKSHVAMLLTQGQSGIREAQAAQFFIGDGSLMPWTLLTYAGLHASWAHLGSNGIWLLAFGSPVARRFGTARFIVFFCFAAIAGAGAHFIAHQFGVEPVIGASAAIAGAMGAAMRFAFQPGVPLGQGGEIAWPTPLPLMQVFTDRRTLTFLAVWFVTNLLFGIAAGPLGLSEAPIAWEAHIGGLVAGLLAFPMFDRAAPFVTDMLASASQQAHSGVAVGGRPADDLTGGADDSRSHSSE